MAFPTVSAFGRNSAQRVFRPLATPHVLISLQVLIQSAVEKSAVDLHSVIIHPMENQAPPLAAGKTQLSLHQVLNSCVNITPIPTSAPICLKPRCFLMKPPETGWVAEPLHWYGCLHGSFH